jgi:hypothetical protein
MISKIKKYLAVFSSVVVLSMPVLMPAAVAAEAADNISGGVKCGVNLDPGSIVDGGTPACDIGAEAASQRVSDIIKLIINIFSLVVGVTAVIMIIIGGFKYIISGGDSSNVQGAKNTIMFAIIGLVVVALAQFIVRYVLARVSPT